MMGNGKKYVKGVLVYFKGLGQLLRRRSGVGVRDIEQQSVLEDATGAGDGKRAGDPGSRTAGLGGAALELTQLPVADEGRPRALGQRPQGRVAGDEVVVVDPACPVGGQGP